MHTVLHVGANKTGSTALQKTFSDHAALLRERGILYPATDKPGHSQLILKWLDEDEYRHAFARHNPDKRAAGVAASDRFWRAIAADLEAGGVTTLVISSEYIMGMRPESLGRLLGHLRSFSDSVSVVGYFRSPGSHYLSAMQQRVKYGHVLKAPDAATRYLRRAEKLSRLGAEALHLRIFERDAFLFRDIVRDFAFNYLGFPEAEARALAVTDANTSISAEGMVLMSEFNRCCFPDRRIPGHPLHVAALDLLARMERQTGCSKPRLTPEVMAIVEASNREDLRGLRDRFGIAFGDVDYEAPPRPVGPVPEDWRVEDVVDYDPAILARLRRAMLEALSAPAAERDEIAPGMPEPAVERFNFRLRDRLRQGAVP